MNTTAASSALPQPEFLQLMGQLRPRLHRYCARMTGSVLDGEDVVQETFIKAAQGYDPQAVQHVESWLFRIAHNAAMDFLRRKTREQALFIEEDPYTMIDTRAEADRRHVVTAALRTFMRLSAAQRSTIILADVLGHTLDEVAEVTGTSQPAVKAALHRGRARLRELALQPDDAAPPAALSLTDQTLLAAYAERFNRRDFDTLRDMLGEDVRLDLVARHQVDGRAAVSNYFGNYAKFEGLYLTPGNIEGRPALLVDTEQSEGPGARPYFIVMHWKRRKIASIRDFRYARYAAESLHNITGIRPTAFGGTPSQTLL
jgi:RNA polymerase sigma-70 factor (ECF subfamily)